MLDDAIHRVLVTGGAGFIGVNLVRHLLAEQHHVVNVDKLTYAGNLASLTDVADHPHYQFVRADIEDARGLSEIFAAHRPQAVVHLAAETHVDRSIDAPQGFVSTNVVGTYQLLQAARRYWRRRTASEANCFRLLHVSTDEVYGSLPEPERGRETSPYDPRSPYAATKAASDHLVWAWYHTYGLPVIVAHASNNYGPYQYPEKLVPTVVIRALLGRTIPVYGTGQQVRDWLYVGDHCRALRLLLLRGRVGQAYHLGGNDCRKNIDLVQELCAALDALCPRPAGGSYAEQIRFVADRPGHDQRYALDTSKIEQELGWRPSADGTRLRETVAWYVQHRAWWEAMLAQEGTLERQGLSGGAP